MRERERKADVVNIGSNMKFDQAAIDLARMMELHNEEARNTARMLGFALLYCLGVAVFASLIVLYSWLRT